MTDNRISAILDGNAKSPPEMSHDTLLSEWREIYETMITGTSDPEEDAKLLDRRTDLWNEMESRVDAEPPECPECSSQSWSQEFGQPKRCTNCDYHPGYNEDSLREAIDDYWRTVKHGRSNAETE